MLRIALFALRRILSRSHQVTEMPEGEIGE